MEPHTNVHVFSCSSYPTPLIVLDLWECPHLALNLLSVRPPFLRPPYSSSSSPWAPSFWQIRELGAIIIINKTFGINAGRSGVRILDWGKCSLRILVVDARVKYPLYLTNLFQLGITACLFLRSFSQLLPSTVYPCSGVLEQDFFFSNAFQGLSKSSSSAKYFSGFWISVCELRVEDIMKKGYILNVEALRILNIFIVSCPLWQFCFWLFVIFKYDLARFSLISTTCQLLARNLKKNSLGLKNRFRANKTEESKAWSDCSEFHDYNKYMTSFH